MKRRWRIILIIAEEQLVKKPEIFLNVALIITVNIIKLIQKYYSIGL